MKLENKVAIVTGATSGIGLGVVKEFVKEGAKVVICGITEEEAQNAYNEVLNEVPNAELLPIKVDVSSNEEIVNVVNKTIEKWGKIDVLVNNAGITQAAPLTDTTEEMYEKVMKINTTGTVNMTREVVKHMSKNGGSIINTSSIVGIYGGTMQTGYTASKFAINGLTKGWAKELGRMNIRVNAVAPGVIETNMVKEHVRDEMKQKMLMMIPLGRTGQVEDLTKLYLYLASDDSKYTTGSIINVDGGLLM